MIFFASGSKLANDVTTNAAVSISNQRFTEDLPKVLKVIARIKNGEETVAAVKAEKVGFTEVQYAKRYMSDDSITRMVAIFEDGSKQQVKNKKGKQIVDTWVSRDATDETAITEYAMLLGRYSDRQIKFVPQKADGFIAENPNGIIINWATQYLKPAIAGANGLTTGRANAGLGKRSVEMSLLAGTAWTAAYLRSVIKGRDDRFLEDAKTPTGLSKQIISALGYAGVSGWMPERFGLAGLALVTGNDDFSARNSIEFATDTPVQSSVKRSFKSVAGLLSGDPRPGDRMQLRRLASFGLTDTALAHLIREALQTTGLEEPLGIDGILDFIYPELDK